MCFMWTIPLLLVLWCTARENPGPGAGPRAAPDRKTACQRGALLALAVFGFAEAFVGPLLDIWKPTSRVRHTTRVVVPVAHYVLPAEAALGALVVWWYRFCGGVHCRPGTIAVGAVMTAALYTGALSLSHWLIEGWE